MAQINLLKQNSAPRVQNLPLVAMRVLLGIFLLLVVYYGWIFSQSKSISKDVLAAQKKAATDKQAAASTPERKELLVRQLQLKNMQTLLAKHTYFSQLFPKLAESTLKTAIYSHLKIGDDGGILLTASVPSLEDLDKYLQVFNLTEVNKNFNSVTVSSFSKVQDKNSTAVNFEVRMKYNPELIRYQAPKNPS